MDSLMGKFDTTTCGPTFKLEYSSQMSMVLKYRFWLHPTWIQSTKMWQNCNEVVRGCLKRLRHLTPKV